MIELNYVQMYGVILMVILLLDLVKAFIHQRKFELEEILSLRIGAFLIYSPFVGRTMGWW